MTRSELTRWFPYFVARPFASVRLVCLPYAGAGAAAFRTWGQAFGEHVEVCAVEPPGRWGRLKEAPFGSVVDLAAAVGQALSLLPPLPQVVVGYSLGALTGFELCRWWRNERQECPKHLVVAARRGPDQPLDAPVSGLPDSELLHTLARSYGPLPAALIDDFETRQLVLAILRADLRCVESYRFRAGSPLDCPITALGGRADPSTSAAALDAWNRMTRADFRRHSFDGGHFFLNEDPMGVIKVVADVLRLASVSPAASAGETSSA